MTRACATLALTAALAFVWSRGAAAATAGFSQPLAGTVTETGTSRPERLRLRLKATQGDPAATVAGWGHWGAGSSWVGGSFVGGTSPTLLLWLADDKARVCTLSGLPQASSSTSQPISTVTGTYTCIDYTGVAAGGGAFTLKRPPRPRAPAPVGMPGY